MTKCNSFPDLVKGAGAPEIRVIMTPDTIRGAGRILSMLQGCEDPYGQSDYYEGLFKDLFDRMLEQGLAIGASQIAGDGIPADGLLRRSGGSN
jgi:hypothetical protein